MMNIIAACCRNRGIGLGGALPWRFKKDLQYFKSLTIGDGNNAIVVGNSTHKRLPMLPKRDTLVLANMKPTSTYSKNTHYFNDITSLHEFCKGKKYTNVWIAGGTHIYQQFLSDPLLHSIYLTNIDIDVPCDTYFPDIPPSFSLASQSYHKERGIDLSFQIYRRKSILSPKYHNLKGTLISHPRLI